MNVIEIYEPVTVWKRDRWVTELIPHGQCESWEEARKRILGTTLMARQGKGRLPTRREPREDMVLRQRRDANRKRAQDLTGRRFGRLTVQRQSINTGHGKRWLCECDCGTRTVIDGRYLTRTRKPREDCGEECRLR